MNPETAAASQSKPQGVYSELDSLLKTRQTASKLNLSFARPSKALMSGPIRTRYKGRGMEFEEVRIYQPGDDIRTIDWRVTARTRVPHTKLFQEEREKPVLLLVDQRSNMFFGSQRCFKSVYATHLAATLGWAAINNNDRIGAFIFGDSEQRDIRPKRSKHAQLGLLHEMLKFNQALTSPIAQGTRTALCDILSDARRVAKPGTKVFIISDFYDFNQACEKPLYLLSQHNDVVLFHVYDLLEKTWPDAAQLYVSNGNHRMPVDGGANRFQKRYQKQFEHHRNALRVNANRLAISLVDTCTTEDPDRLLSSLFGRSKGQPTTARPIPV